MTTPRKILDRHNQRPLKRFGQSFLVDMNIMKKIVDSADIGPDDPVVEIGAGVGIMTGLLADRARTVIALEVDRRMIAILAEEMAERRNVTVLDQDVLQYDFSSTALRGRGKIIVVGNIPYNISSQIMLRLIHFRSSLTSAVLMYQKELAERIIAVPGSPQYGSLSVLTTMYMRASRVVSVPPNCFFPRPKVDSIVLRLLPREEPLHHVNDHDHFQKVLRAAFAKRRKTLLNSLKNNPYIIIEEGRATEALKAAGIDPRRRGETLAAGEFALLANHIGSEM